MLADASLAPVTECRTQVQSRALERMMLMQRHQGGAAARSCTAARAARMRTRSVRVAASGAAKINSRDLRKASAIQEAA